MAKATQRLYLTADDKVVLEGDADAAFLLAAEGSEIPDGYSEPKAPKQEAKPADKSAKAPPNKADIDAGPSPKRKSKKGD